MSAADLHVLHLNASDAKGGAAIAAHRLHDGLRAQGVHSQMLVYRRYTDDPHVLTAYDGWLSRRYASRAPLLDKLPLRRYPDYAGTPFTPAWVPSLVPRHVHRLNPDIVHLHWPGDGFMRVRTLARLNRPLVWTLHDMWAFTGGCHYSGGCMRYTDACGACPQLGSTRENDLSRTVWKRKRDNWRDLRLTIVTPSRWLAECVQRSSLLGDAAVQVIPNGIDTTTFRPYERALARDVFGLPQERKLILFGALEADSDPRKGFHHLRAAAAHLADDPALELVMFGNRHAPEDSWPLPVHAVGVLDDDRLLALLYSACDVFVAPSQADNLPNTVLEALACGTPCVAFNVGGLPDLITHQHNGYLATPFDEADLAAGIRFVLEDTDRHHALAAAARETAVEQFALDTIAERYLALYETVLAQDSGSD